MPHPTCSWQTRTIPPAQPSGWSASVLTSSPQILLFGRNHASVPSLSPGKTRSKETSLYHLVEPCSGIAGRAYPALTNPGSDTAAHERHHATEREPRATTKSFHGLHQSHFLDVDPHRQRQRLPKRHRQCPVPPRWQVDRQNHDSALLDLLEHQKHFWATHIESGRPGRGRECENVSAGGSKICPR